MFVFVVLTSFVSAISTNLKQEYEKGETIMAEISGNIIEDIKAEQIEFIRGHVRVPFDYGFEKLDEKWFLWAVAPEKEENYTLVIRDVITTIAGRKEKINFEQNFSVRGNLTDYSIKPGAILADGNFKINIQLNEDLDRNISVDFPSEREVILKPGKNEIGFDIGDINETRFVIMKLGKYDVPVYINKKTEVEKKVVVLRIYPEKIESTVLFNDKVQYPFQVINVGNLSLEDIRIKYNKEIFSISTDRFELAAGKSIELNLSFIGKVDKYKENGINEIILINFEDKNFELPIRITFTENESNRNTPYLKNYTTLQYCKEFDGIVCTAGEICDGETKTSFEGACCVGKCKSPETGGGRSWIGYVTAGIVIIILIYVFLRYRKTKNREDPLARRLSEIKK